MRTDFTSRLLTLDSDWTSIRSDWNRLYALTPGVTPWQSWDYLSRWWHAMHGRRKLRIVVVEAGGTVQLLMPLQLDTLAPWQLRVLEPVGMPDDINRPRLAIGPPDVAAFECAMDALWKRRREWDALRIDEKTADDEEIDWLRSLAGTHKASVQSTPFHSCPFLQLPDCWKTFIDSRGTRFARNLRAARRSLEARGSVRAERFDAASEVMRAFDTLVDLHHRSWKKDAKIGLSQSDAYRAFYRTFVATMAESGMARAWVLSCNDQPVAATLAFHDKGVYYSTQIVHDDDYSRSSPGTLLESIEMESLIDEARFATYDFMGGAPSNKRRWTDSALQTCRIWLIRRSVRGQAFAIYYFKIKPLLRRMGIFPTPEP